MTKEAQANDWQPIETVPMDTDVILGWWSPQPDPTPVWCMELGWAGHANRHSGGYSDGWVHGQATHWQLPPLPPTPSTHKAK